MRIRPSGIPLPNPIDHAVVCADDHHRATYGLTALGGTCSVVSTLSDLVAAASTAERLALIDTRPEAILDACALVGAVVASDQPFHIIVPQVQVGLLDVLMDDVRTDVWALTGLHCDAASMHLEMVQSQEGDRAGADLVAGLRWGSVSTWASEPSPDVGEVSILRGKLASALLLLRDLSAGEVAPTPDVAHVAPPLDLQARKDLENRVVTLQRKLDVLQRKYDALAGSRLGRLTLARWERNRPKAAQ